MPRTPIRLITALGVIIAAGGYIQVWNAAVFWCGRVEAFPNTAILALLALSQAALYLAAATSTRWRTPYHLTQYAALPFVLAGLLQVFAPHPGTILFFAALAIIPTVLARRRIPAFATAFYIVTTLGLLAALGQIPFTLPGVTVPHWLIALAALAAAAVALPITRRIRSASPQDAGLARHLPLTLLLFPILRAKLPDIAYDSLSYKTTLPYQLADWLTGDTAIIDGYMLGTNLQEMLNALLIAITKDYLPPFVSTISFILLALIIPLAFPIHRHAAPAARGIIAFAGLATFVLTEAGLGQGTAYQEPLLLLFLVAALIRCPVWPAFLAMAIAVKINAGFIVPLVVFHHILGYRGFWTSPRHLLIGALASLLALAPQLHRNTLFSGRLLGLSETLASLTDPFGPNQIMQQGTAPYDQTIRGGIVNNAVQSACNMWLLDGLCPIEYQKNVEAGFSVFPASRAPLFATLFALAVLLNALRRPSDSVVATRNVSPSEANVVSWPAPDLIRGYFGPLTTYPVPTESFQYPDHRTSQASAGQPPAGPATGIASALLFAGCYIGFLAFLSTDRYFLPISFGFPLLLLINPGAAAHILRALPQRSWLLPALACWLIGADLIPGVFANVSWICQRPLIAAAQTADLRQPQTPVQRFLADTVQAYRQVCPPPGLPPVILAENDKLNAPYLGTQRIFHVFTQTLIQRFFAADPARQAAAADAIIALVAETPFYAESVLGPAEADFVPCFDDGTLHVSCSIRLAPAGPHCAASLY